LAELSKMVCGLQQSGIRVIMNLALTMPDVVRLEVGEPLFDTPPHIVEAAAKAAREGYTHYTANAGLPSLREAIVAQANRDYGTKFTPESVQVGVGAVGAISTAMRALTDPGDEVLVPDPGWPNYESIVKCAGAFPRRYTLDPAAGFLPEPDRIRELIGRRTKVLIVNSPSNPLGTVLPAETMRGLVELAREKGLFLVSDEVYEKIIYEGRHASAATYDLTGIAVTVSGVSKSYAMTGWRLGWALARPEIIRQMAKLQESFVACAPSVSQKAAEAALTGPQACVEEMRNGYDANRKVAADILDRHGIKYVRPRGAFYVWIDVGAEDSTAFALNLLQKERVAVAPGATFGPSGQRFIRISLAAKAEHVREGLRRLVSHLAG